MTFYLKFFAPFQKKHFGALESSFLRFRQNKKNRQLILKILDNFIKTFFRFDAFSTPHFDTFQKGGQKEF